MKRILLIIFSFIFWLWFIITNILMFAIAFVIWILTLPFDRKLAILHQFSSFWGYSYIWLNPLWPTTISGRYNIKRGKTYVILSNHQSMLDILVLYGLFRPYKWVSKKENFKIPIIGWLMRLNRYVEIDRGSKESYRKLLATTGNLLQKGNSILMFPEGTRGPGGNIQHFKDGAFRMAIDNQANIILVVLDGTGLTIPRGGVIMSGRKRIRVKICQEIPFESFMNKSAKELMAEIREMMLIEYNRLLTG